MTPVFTLYLLGGCVAFAAILFLVMMTVSALRPPPLPPVVQMPMPMLPMPAPIARHAPPPAPLARAIVPTAPPNAPTYIAPPQPTPRAPSAPRMQSAARASRPQVAPREPAPAYAGVVPAATRLPPLPPQNAVRLEIPSARKSWPSMPEHRARRFGRFMLKWSVRLTLVSVIVGAIGTSVVVAYPTVLDRLADDYEWFGDDTAWVAREYARDAHEAVKEFVREL